MEQGKKCSRCEEWKPYDQFYKSKRHKDGYKGLCIICHRTPIPKVTDEKPKDKDKKCFRCGEWKLFKDFYVSKRNKDGYEGVCIECKHPKKPKPLVCSIVHNRIGKICTKCGEWKLFDHFTKDKKFIDGHCSRCKPCKAEDDKQYREQNRDKVKIGRKRHYEENKETINAEKRKQWHENKDYLNTIRKPRDAQYREENRESIREQHKQWRKNNPDSLKRFQTNWNQSESFKKSRTKYKKSDKGRAVGYKSDMKRRSLEHKVYFTRHERKEILDRDKWKCQSCGIKVHDRHKGNWNTPDKAHIDHIIPIIKGGNSEPNNLQTLCRTCNIKKKDKVELQLSLF